MFHFSYVRHVWFICPPPPPKCVAFFHLLLFVRCFHLLLYACRVYFVCSHMCVAVHLFLYVCLICFICFHMYIVYLFNLFPYVRRVCFICSPCMLCMFHLLLYVSCLFHLSSPLQSEGSESEGEDGLVAFWRGKSFLNYLF